MWRGRGWRRVAGCVVVAGFALLGSRAAADEGEHIRQVGDVVYTVPAGWRQSTMSGYAELRTDDDERFPVDCTVRVYPATPKGEFDGRSGGGDVEAFARERMAAELAALVADDDDTEVIGEEEKLPLTVGEMKGVAVARGLENGRRRIEVTFAWERPTRYALVRFTAPARTAEQAAAVSKTIKESVEPFLASLRFVGEDAEALLGPPTPGELHGVWWGNGVENRYGMNGMELKLVTAAYTFYRDGRFHRGVPETGLDDFDFDQAARETTGRVGNYLINDKKIELSYADGKTRSLNFNPASKSIAEHPVNMSPARLPPDGFTFEGVRRRQNYTSFSTGGMSTGGVGGSHTWVFRKDGTVTHDGFVSVTGGFDNGGGFAGSSKRDGVSGTYRVTDGRLEITEPDENGQPKTTRSLILLFENADGSPPEILVGGDVIKPVKE